MQAANATKGSATQRFFCYTRGDALQEVFGNGAGHSALDISVRKVADADALLRDLRQRGPGTFLVDVSSFDKGLDLQHAVQSAQGQTRLIALGKNRQLAYYRSLIKSGWDEYFVMDGELEELHEHLLKSEHKTLSKNVVIHGVKPGIGASLLAAGISQFLSQGRDVAAIELNWSNPSVNYWLGIDQLGLMHKLAGQARRIDALLISQTVLRVNQRLYYLGGYQHLAAAALGQDDSERLFQSLAHYADCNVWITDQANAICSRYVLKHAEHVIIVTDLSLPSLRACNDMLAWCSEHAIQPLLVLTHPYREQDIDSNQLVASLKRSITLEIPALKGLKAQLLQDILPGSDDSKLRKHIQKIAAQLYQEQPVARRWWQMR